MTATVTKLRTGDKDAVAIGNLCEKAKGSIVDSVKYLIEAGQKLTIKKDEVGHGNWLSWLKANKDALGIEVQKNGCKAAERLIKLAKANPTLTSDFTETQASQISKSVWGNTERAKSDGGKRKQREHYAEPKIIAAMDRGLTDAEISAETGVGQRQVRHIRERVTARRQAVEDATPNIDAKALSMSAQQKLVAAERAMKRKLELEHAARMRVIDEEVRKRVVAEGKDYVANMKEMEAKAWEDQKHWRAMVNDHKPPFTKEQFKAILMCLHPDGERTPEKLSQAFRLFNSKKLQLSGEK